MEGSERERFQCFTGCHNMLFLHYGYKPNNKTKVTAIRETPRPDIGICKEEIISVSIKLLTQFLRQDIGTYKTISMTGYVNYGVCYSKEY